MRERLQHHIQQLLDTKIPFLLLRPAGEDQVRVLSQKDDRLHQEKIPGVPNAVFAPFQSENPFVYIIGHNDLSFSWNVTDEYEDSGDFSIDSFRNDTDEKKHTALVEKAVLELKKTSLKKVVLSRKQHLKKTSTDLEILSKLLDTYPRANCYLFYHPKVGTWLGATPEVLLSVHDGILQTMSLAGTAVFEKGVEHEWGNKEKEEQQLVTDFIVDSLKQNGATDIVESEVETSRAGSIIHLRTKISATINSSKINDILNALHPTPAVCGLPRNLAMAFILENERYDRSFYTGYLGIEENTQSKALYFVNLRCMKLLEKDVEIYVGGGITAMSDPRSEYEETLNKLKTMARLV